MKNVNFDITKALSINKTYLRERLVIVGEKIAGDAKVLIEPRVDTGRARDSIMWAIEGKRGNVSGAAKSDDRIKSPSDDLTVRVGSDVDYFPYIEFGTKYMARRAPLRLSLSVNRNNIKAILNK